MLLYKFLTKTTKIFSQKKIRKNEYVKILFLFISLEVRLVFSLGVWRLYFCVTPMSLYANIVIFGKSSLVYFTRFLLYT